MCQPACAVAQEIGYACEGGSALRPLAVQGVQQDVAQAHHYRQVEIGEGTKVGRPVAPDEEQAVPGEIVALERRVLACAAALFVQDGHAGVVAHCVPFLPEGE